MQSIRIISSPPLRIRKWNQLSQFRWTSTKVVPTEKTQAGYILNTVVMSGTSPDVTTEFMEWYRKNMVASVFWKTKTDVSKARKMATGGLGSAVGLPIGVETRAFYIFINNSRSKQDKKNSRHPVVDIGK